MAGGYNTPIRLWPIVLALWAMGALCGALVTWWLT